MENKLKGLLHIVIGGLLIVFPPVSSIDLESLNRAMRASRVEFHDTHIVANGSYQEVYSHSIWFMIIGVLFIAIGIIEIRKEQKNAKENTN